MNTLVQNNTIISRELTAVEMENLNGGFDFYLMGIALCIAYGSLTDYFIKEKDPRAMTALSAWYSMDCPEFTLP